MCHGWIGKVHSEHLHAMGRRPIRKCRAIHRLETREAIAAVLLARGRSNRRQPEERRLVLLQPCRTDAARCNSERSLVPHVPNIIGDRRCRVLLAAARSSFSVQALGNANTGIGRLLQLVEHDAHIHPSATLHHARLSGRRAATVQQEQSRVAIRQRLGDGDRWVPRPRVAADPAAPKARAQSVGRAAQESRKKLTSMSAGAGESASPSWQARPCALPKSRDASGC